MSDRYSHTEAVWDFVTHDHHGVPTPESLRTGLTQGFGGEGWVRLGHCSEDKPTAPLDSGPGPSGHGWAPAGSRVHRHSPRRQVGRGESPGACSSGRQGRLCLPRSLTSLPPSPDTSVPWVTARGPRAHTCSSLGGRREPWKRSSPQSPRGLGRAVG